MKKILIIVSIFFCAFSMNAQFSISHINDQRNDNIPAKLDFPDFSLIPSKNRFEMRFKEVAQSVAATKIATFDNNRLKYRTPTQIRGDMSLIEAPFGFTVTLSNTADTLLDMGGTETGNISALVTRQGDFVDVKINFLVYPAVGSLGNTVYLDFPTAIASDIGVNLGHVQVQGSGVLMEWENVTLPPPNLKVTDLFGDESNDRIVAYLTYGGAAQNYGRMKCHLDFRYYIQ